MKVISNKKIAKVVVPLFFIVPPNSQAEDIISFLAFFDKKFEKLAELIQRIKFDYEEIVWKMIKGERTKIDDLLEEIDINIETVDEEEYEEKIRKAFKKHKILLEVFEVEEPKEFYFTLFKSKVFFGGFEGFRKPIIVYIFDGFHDISFLRSYLLWYLVNKKKIRGDTAEVILDYVVWLKYRLKIGEIDKEYVERYVEDLKERRYWIFETFGDWIEKLEFLLDYDFEESVWEFIEKKDKSTLLEVTEHL